MRPPTPRWPLRPALPVLLLWALALPALATPSGPVETLRSALDSLADPQRQAASDNLDAAAAAEREAAELAAGLATLRDEAANAPARAAELERRLQADPGQTLDQWRRRLPASHDLEALERLLERERAEAAQLGNRIAALTADLAATLAPLVDDGRTDAELERRADELAVPVVAADGEPAALTESRRLRQAAELRRLQAQRELRAAEDELAGSRQRLQELELRVLRRELAAIEPRQALLRQRIAELGREALQARVQAAEEALAALAASTDAPLVRARGENLALAEELLAANEALAEQRRTLSREDQALAADRAALHDAMTRLELGGQSEQVGTWLWAELRRLEPVDAVAERLAEVRRTLADRRLRLIALGETQRDLGDVPAAARDLRALDPNHQDEDAPVADVEGEDPLCAALRDRAVLADALEPLLWRQVATLEQSERSLQARLDANRELRQQLDRHLLWIRSHAPVDLAWLRRLPDGAYDLVKPSRFATTGELLARRFGETPWPTIASLLLVAALAWLALRARPRLERLASSIREVRKDRYRRTLESLGWTLLAALPLPAAFWLGGALLQDIGETGKYSDSLGRALQFLLMPAFTLAFLGWLVRERGLAHAHFRWTRPRREALQRWLPAAKAVLLPMYFVIALAFIRNQDLAIDVSARLALVAMTLFAAWATWRLLAPERLWHTRGPSVEPSLLRRLLRGAVPAALVACAGLALGGYVYSATFLMESLFASVGVLTAVAVLHGLLARWFALGERRLALRRLEQRREAEAQARAEGEADDGGGEAVPQDIDDDLALDKVNLQTQRLLRAVKLSLLAIGLVWVWADVLPAFARLDEVVLWTIAEKAADGGSLSTPITLMAVLLGLLALALTFVAARNLPGLLEIGLLSKVNIDAASRYAITSVSRYAIVLVGIVVGLGLLGLRWSQLQWMAAALTVGLGFGLQEIFANFVSGLILLFERPFRVGDVITVNDLSGTVTRIRTRATTILDFDNKEIVVPNKSFITGQLVNWTLTDNTTRIIVKVGVDYGTDPALVHRLLMQAAEENPRVLKDWAPRSWLLEFGANSLDFELRVFVNGMTDRLAVRNELNMRLIDLFAEHGVGFAFPQLDLHVRDLPEALSKPAAPDPAPG